ncbi:unnamed protein product [Phytophthora fragariaefolia]|uniref:Unnamed protein product n=1 Tax=Phytophthora fragariaefolia TaxID=1490495 RepID=A0A9W6Y5U0_9STRA|nr:unnamed protein product [Phytophthora fragariaefolia]
MALSDEEDSSDEDGEHGHLGRTGMLGNRDADATGLSETNQVANGGNGTASMRLPSRHAKRGPSDETHSSSDHILSSREHEFVVNPDELVESDESEEELAAENNDLLPSFDDGHNTARS